jgi:iron(III) transport system permease protein
MAELRSKEISLPPGKRLGRKWHLPSLRAFLMLWLPAFVVAGAVLLPVAYLILRATGAERTFRELVLQAGLMGILAQTVFLAVGVTLTSMMIAVPLAWLTVRTDLPFRHLWTVLTPLPLVIPSYVGAYLIVSALGPVGMVQKWLEGPLGITRLPEIYGFPGALLVLTLLSYPFILLSVRAALLKMDPALEEASQSLGYSPWRTFFRVILPQLRPAIAAGGLLVALYVLRDFGAVSIMRYDTFTRVIYIQYSSTFDRSTAAALSLVLVSLALLLLALELWTRGKARYYTSSSKGNAPPNIFRLGRWRWPALLFCALVVGVALLLPAGMLVFWLWRGLLAGETVSGLWQATGDSILASALTAFAALAAALPISILSVRRPGPASKVLDRVTYIAFGLPGIVIALAMVFFGLQYARPLYQTLPLLVFAYTILFLPEAVGAVQASLLQVHPNMEEAGRSLGKKPLDVFRGITLPLIRPGMVTGAGLVFLTTMKELPATLILAPNGFKTLSTMVWGAVSEAFFAQAATPALLLIIVSSFPMGLLILRDIKDGS